MTKTVFLETHNLKNKATGLGTFNYELIKGLNQLEFGELELTLNVKEPKMLEAEFGEKFKYHKYTNLSRHALFRTRKSYDLWHSVNQNTKVEPYCVKNYLLTVHDVNFVEEISSDMNHRLNKLFLAKLEKSTAITYISEFAKKQTHTYFNVPNVPEYIIPNGNPISTELDTSHFVSKIPVDKPFKVPNLINQIAYKFFRKSKAKRSYEYANRLLKFGIGTPQPIAFVENFTFLGLEKSYYISENLDCNLTFRELVEIPDYPDHENILKQFVQFSFYLHESGVEFLDHSPGNTLIKKNQKGNYDFYLVDLNRMNFHNTMDFEIRMKNLSRLTPKKEMILIMSTEYAKLYNKPVDEVFNKMWQYTLEFQEKYHRKRRFKAKLFFLK